MIAIRHTPTGVEKTFPDLQRVSNFLGAEQEPRDWEIPTNLGPYPLPDADAVQATLAERTALKQHADEAEEAAEAEKPAKRHAKVDEPETKAAKVEELKPAKPAKPATVAKPVKAEPKPVAKKTRR